jgi:hypothetical protein
MSRLSEFACREHDSGYVPGARRPAGEHLSDCSPPRVWPYGNGLTEFLGIGVTSGPLTMQSGFFYWLRI